MSTRKGRESKSRFRSSTPAALSGGAVSAQSQSDGALFATIENGIRLTGMPAFGNGTAESAYGSWGLVHFIRHLPKITRQLPSFRTASTLGSATEPAANIPIEIVEHVHEPLTAEQPFFTPKARVIRIGATGEAQVYEYISEEQAAADAVKVKPDGSIGTSMPHWIESPTSTRTSTSSTCPV